MKTVVMLDLTRRLDQPDHVVDRTLRDYLKRTGRMVEQQYDLYLGRDCSATVILKTQQVAIIWDVLDGQRVQEIAQFTKQCWEQVTAG